VNMHCLKWQEYGADQVMGVVKHLAGKMPYLPHLPSRDARFHVIARIGWRIPFYSTSFVIVLASTRKVDALWPLFGILPPRASARARSEQVDELHGSMVNCDGVFLPLPRRPGISPASHHRLLQATKPSTRIPGSIFERRCRTSRSSTTPKLIP
jgi:hypothetical protein